MSNNQTTLFDRKRSKLLLHVTRLLHEAEYSAFESTLISSIVSLGSIPTEVCETALPG